MANAQQTKAEDFYKLLSIPKSASQAEIKKAYKKLAAKLHPDKGGDNEKFQQLQHAYDILSDVNKREIYDQFGEEGLNGNFQNQQRHEEYQEFKTSRPKQRSKAKTKLIFCAISLEEAYCGCLKEIEYIQRNFCSKCNGTGTKNPNLIFSCAACEGTGKKAALKRLAGFFVEQEENCSECRGMGKYHKKDCSECFGEKFYFRKTSVTIEIEAGVENDTQILKLEEGDDEENMKKGDLCVQINIKKHQLFKRFGDDLFIELNLNLFSALLGGNVSVKLLDGKTVAIKAKDGEVILPNSLRKVHGLGMPCKSIFSKKGDLIIKFNLVFPLYMEDYDLKKIKIMFSKDKNFKNLEKLKKDNAQRLNKDKNFNGNVNENNESNEENEYLILEKTDKKMEDFIDPDEDKKKSRRFFFDEEFNYEEDKEDRDVFGRFRNYSQNFCQHQ